MYIRLTPGPGLDQPLGDRRVARARREKQRWQAAGAAEARAGAAGEQGGDELRVAWPWRLPLCQTTPYAVPLKLEVVIEI